MIPGSGLLGQYAAFKSNPEPFFRLTPVPAGQAICFAVKRGEIERRMDPIFHTTIDYGILLKSLYKSTHTLADFYEFIDSGRPILSRICTEGIPAYEVGHISNGCFKPTSIIVNYKTDKILKTHDILTGRVGGLGCFCSVLR